jgi:hypothetical protein
VVRAGVPRREYFALTNQAATGFTRAQLARRGVFVRFRVTIRGFEGIPITLQRQVLDAGTGAQVSKEASITITPPNNDIERDWHDWTPLPVRGGPFYIVIKLLAPGETAPLATLQTVEFDRST